jgi:catechol 2,3-dioxygenase-like lactoylglutathione lyase family enzyme
MPRLTRIHHVQLAMPRGEEARARVFYEKGLGLTEMNKPDDQRDDGGVWFEGGEIRLLIGVERVFTAAASAHPAFQVEGLSDLRRHLASMGHRTHDAPTVDGLARCHVLDPFGNRIELLEQG